MRSDVVDPGPELFDRVVRKADSALFGQSSEDLPLVARVAGRVDDSQTHLHSTFGIDYLNA